MENKKKGAYCNDLMIVRTLGSGYNAKVKLAFDRKSGRYVAVKIIKKIDRSNLKTLQNELQIMSQLKHQNIIELIDVQQNQDYFKKNGSSKKVTYIVIELAEGGELFDYVANAGAFSYVTGRSYFHQLIDALSYAHSLKIAHRDLKPENLLFDSQFRLKVADWGFATIIKDKNTTVLGTESYMAPEIHNKQPYNSNEVDLFASAIVLFIMIVGTPPFTKAEIRDPYYNLIATGKNDKFWQQHLKFKKDKNFFTNEFKDLINNMLHLDPSKRLTIEQIKNHPFMTGPILTHQQLYDEFSQKKQLVDKEIELQRQQKLIEKQKQQQQGNNINAMQGFRSMNSQQQQQFDQLEATFTTLNLQRQLVINQRETNFNLEKLGTVYSSIDSQLLFKYLLIVLLNENIQQSQIKLSENKYKLEFSIQDDEENIEVEAQICQYDELVNQVIFMKKSGNSINYYNYIRQFKESLNKIKQDLNQTQSAKKAE